MIYGPNFRRAPRRRQEPVDESSTQAIISSAALLQIDSQVDIGYHILNWLQVSCSTELPEIDQGISHEFEAKMVHLFGLKTQ